MMEKTTRSLGDKLDKFEADHERLRGIFGIPDDKFLEAPKYKSFLESLERRNELRRELMVKEDRVRKLKEEAQERQKTLEVESFYYGIKLFRVLEAGEARTGPHESRNDGPEQKPAYSAEGWPRE